MKIFICIWMILFSVTQSKGKAGPHPSSIKWHSIENEATRIIFPDSTLTAAKRIADMIGHIHGTATRSIGPKSKKIDILLNTNRIHANGYVAPGPYRSEFYTTGPQNFNQSGSLSWLDDLALHEYRHALQFCNVDRGTIKFYHIIYGDIGWALAMFGGIPFWFFEGDAVCTETVLSPAGRGRTPSFFERQRALLLNDKNYSYTQASYGSLKQLLPDRYSLGYALVNYYRNQRGAEAWAQYLTTLEWPKTKTSSSIDAPKYSLGLFYSRLSYSQLYALAYQDLKEQWKKELDTLQLTPVESLKLNESATVTDYTFPHFVEDGSIVCLKNSYDDTPQLVRIKDGSETVLTQIGIHTESFLGLGNHKVSWTEYRKDARRGAVEYNAIMSFDLMSGQRKQVLAKSKYFSPVFSSDAQKIVVVEANALLKNRIHILAAATGSVLETIPNDYNDFLSYPRWAKKDSSIVYLAKRNSKIAMFQYDLFSKRSTALTDWSAHTLGSYVIYKDWVYFNASFSGINNIYAVNQSGDKQIRQITSVRIGADMPAISADGKQLVFTEQTTMGKRLKSMSLKEEVRTLPVIKVIEPKDMRRYQVLTTTTEHDLLDSIPRRAYEVKAYKGLAPGIKLHSWLWPISIDLQGYNSRSNDFNDLALTLYMGNLLQNFSASLQSGYNWHKNTFNVGGGFTYSKYYLPLTVEANLKDRKHTDFLPASQAMAERGFRQADFAIGTTLPLSWVRGNYITALEAHTSLKHILTRRYVFAGAKEHQSLNFNSIKATVVLDNKRRTALQNLVPKWSQSLELGWQKSLDHNISAEQFSLKTKLTAVGLMKNHGLSFSFNLLRESMDNGYLYEDLFTHARGYRAGPRDWEHVLSVDYSLPLGYPDWGVAGLFFINRIRTNLFYDRGRVYQRVHSRLLPQDSAGAEIILDTKLLNFPILWGLGFRNSFLLNKDPLDPNKKMRLGEFFLSWQL